MTGSWRRRHFAPFSAPDCGRHGSSSFLLKQEFLNEAVGSPRVFPKLFISFAGCPRFAVVFSFLRSAYFFEFRSSFGSKVARFLGVRLAPEFRLAWNGLVRGRENTSLPF